MDNLSGAEFELASLFRDSPPRSPSDDDWTLVRFFLIFLYRFFDAADVLSTNGLTVMLIRLLRVVHSMSLVLHFTNSLVLMAPPLSPRAGGQR